MTFKALLANKDGEKISTDLVELEEKDLMRGDVTIAVDYSTVNYKDGLALTGRAPIIRTFPLIPGIDLSGTVQASAYSGIEVGDRVVPVSYTHLDVYKRQDRAQPFQKLMSFRFVHGSIDYSRRDRVYTNAFLRIFDGEGACHCIQSTLQHDLDSGPNARDRLVNQRR